MQHLLDTNIIVEMLKRNATIIGVVQHIGFQHIAVSDITRAELFYGAKNKVELRYIQKSLGDVVCLPVIAEISAMAVQIVEAYCLSHKARILDALIAATALYYDMVLYTLNVKDFSYVPGLRLLQP
jgi:predicted nucleic acid-binding protein